MVISHGRSTSLLLTAHITRTGTVENWFQCDLSFYLIFPLLAFVCRIMLFASHIRVWLLCAFFYGERRIYELRLLWVFIIFFLSIFLVFVRWKCKRKSNHTMETPFNIIQIAFDKIHLLFFWKSSAWSLPPVVWHRLLSNTNAIV